MAQTKIVKRTYRKDRIRKKLTGTVERPRLTVFKSLRYIYAQIINDAEGKTLVSASSIKMTNGGNIKAAEEVGKLLAEKALAQNLKKVCFDRNGFIYHGVVKSLAEAARSAGLEF